MSPIYDNPLIENKIVTFVIAFDENTSHYSVVKQFIDGLHKNKYAKKAEILDCLEEYLTLTHSRK